MNPHALAGTSSLGWRVCLFRHSDVAIDDLRADDCEAPTYSVRHPHRQPTTGATNRPPCSLSVRQLSESTGVAGRLLRCGKLPIDDRQSTVPESGVSEINAHDPPEFFWGP